MQIFRYNVFISSRSFEYQDRCSQWLLPGMVFIDLDWRSVCRCSFDRILLRRTVRPGLLLPLDERVCYRYDDKSSDQHVYKKDFRKNYSIKSSHTRQISQMNIITKIEILRTLKPIVIYTSFNNWTFWTLWLREYNKKQ